MPKVTTPAASDAAEATIFTATASSPEEIKAVTDAITALQVPAYAKGADYVPPFAVVGEQAQAAVLRTPSNTPLPGGGRWAWCTPKGEWVPKDSPDADPFIPDPVPAADAALAAQA